MIEDNEELETTLTTLKNPVGRPKGVYKYGIPAKKFYKYFRKKARNHNERFFEELNKEHPINELPKTIKSSYEFHIMNKSQPKNKTTKSIVLEGLGDLKELTISITLRK